MDSVVSALTDFNATLNLIAVAAATTGILIWGMSVFFQPAEGSWADNNKGWLKRAAFALVIVGGSTWFVTTLMGVGASFNG